MAEIYDQDNVATLQAVQIYSFLMNVSNMINDREHSNYVQHKISQKPDQRE